MRAWECIYLSIGDRARVPTTAGSALVAQRRFARSAALVDLRSVSSRQSPLHESHRPVRGRRIPQDAQYTSTGAVAFAERRRRECLDGLG